MAEARAVSASARPAGRRPATLLVRTNLVLGFSAALIVVIATVALYFFVIVPISEQSADDQAALLVLSAQTWVELPPDARPYFELEMAENHDLIISEDVRPLFSAAISSGYFELLQANLSKRLGQTIELLVGEDLLWINVPMGGRELQIGFAPERQEIQPLYGAIVIAMLGAAIVFFTSLFIVQRIARPLVRVAEQAEHFRGAREIEPLPETGPRELVSLARNFNTMAQEISVLLANRTTLLAGISHDLRTPLTRMRLALALLPETVDASLIARFERNLESMDELIGDALRFARGTHEAPATVALADYVEEIVSSFEQPVQLDHTAATGVQVQIAPSALRRVLMNIVTNALKHGGQVWVTVSPDSIVVVDDGPGIPAEYRDQVFQPFFRLDASRSVATGGSGLGLAIVAQLCLAHGWTVVIDDAPAGGARVSIQLRPAPVQGA